MSRLVSADRRRRGVEVRTAAAAAADGAGDVRAGYGCAEPALRFRRAGRGVWSGPTPPCCALPASSSLSRCHSALALLLVSLSTAVHRAAFCSPVQPLAGYPKACCRELSASRRSHQVLALLGSCPSDALGKALEATYVRRKGSPPHGARLREGRRARSTPSSSSARCFSRGPSASSAARSSFVRKPLSSLVPTLFFPSTR